MDRSFKSRSFKFVYWIMLIALGADTLDTIYRFVMIGYFGEGTTFPGVNEVIKPDTFDLIVFIIVQLGIIIRDQSQKLSKRNRFVMPN